MKVCVNCGAPVPPKARVCPECGADDETGWSEAADAPHPDLPEDEFNYEEFTKREFGGKQSVPHGISPFWWLVAVLLAALMLYFWFR